MHDTALEETCLRQGTRTRLTFVPSLALINNQNAVKLLAGEVTRRASLERGTRHGAKASIHLSPSLCPTIRPANGGGPAPHPPQSKK
jgi:hypothetical protein